MSGSKKYSISLPEDLAEAVRAHVSPGGFSAYVAEALDHRVAMDKLREIVADFETGDDELTREEVEAARALLRTHHLHGHKYAIAHTAAGRSPSSASSNLPSRSSRWSCFKVAASREPPHINRAIFTAREAMSKPLARTTVGDCRAP